MYYGKGLKRERNTTEQGVGVDVGGTANRAWTIRG